MSYTYQWLHVPSGQRGQRTQDFMSRVSLMEALNNWNRSANGVWLYWTC